MGYIAYYRVSTRGQGESGLGLESQRAILCNYIDCDRLVAEYTEVASGKDIHGRPKLQQAIQQCIRRGHTLAVAKIDRLSRKTEDALAIWGQLDGRLWSADIPQDGPKMDKFTLTIFMAIADRERELIGIRTRAALAAKRQRGETLGTPANMTDEGRQMGAEARRVEATAVDQQLVPYDYLQVLRDDLGLSYGKIAKRLNDQGKRTRNGGKFYAATVYRMLQRADAVAD